MTTGTGLEGVRVLEVGGGISAPMVGKLLADLGAAVVKIEAPGGDPARARGPFPHGQPHPERSGLFVGLNAGKRSLELDLTTPPGQASLQELAKRAHVLVHNLRPAAMAAHGLDYATLSRANPALVLLSLTPFGLTGPYRDYAGEDLNLIHGGGWGYLCPAPGTDPRLPPIKPFGQHALIQAGLHGAIAALGLVLGALRTGLGEHIDLSAQEAVLSILGRNFTTYTYGGQVDSRLSARAYAPNGFFRCKDAHIYLVCIEEEQWQRLLELMGSPAWGQEPRFQDRELRAQCVEELNGYLREWIAGWESEALFRACQERRICASKVFTFDQLPGQEHLLARGFVQALDQPGLGRLAMPGPAYRLERPWWRLRGPAPRLGEANGREGGLFASNGARSAAPAQPRPGAPPLPLAGVRVLDFTWVWAGPYSTLLLSQLGADVVKVESGGRSDLLRRTGTPAQGVPVTPNSRGSFNQLAQGKRSLALTLTDPRGLALAKELAAQSDVVVSNFGTGVMERFGLGAESLHQIKPDLIIAAVSGYGQTGPYRHYMGYGQAAVPLSGVSAWTGYEPGHPQEVHIAYGDPASGAYAACAIAAALVARELHGGGQVIDVSLWESLINTGVEGWMHAALGLPALAPMGNRDPYWAPHNCYRCAGEDAWVSIAVTAEEHWHALCQALGRPELAQDPRFAGAVQRRAHEDALDELLGAWCADQERWSVTRRLQAAGVPAFPSLSAKDLAEDAHLAARAYYGQAPHAEVGVRLHTGVPWRLARRQNGMRGPAPLLGQHTQEVLAEWLGYGAAQVQALQAAGVLR